MVSEVTDLEKSMLIISLSQKVYHKRMKGCPTYIFLILLGFFVATPVLEDFLFVSKSKTCPSAGLVPQALLFDENGHPWFRTPPLVMTMF